MRKIVPFILFVLCLTLLSGLEFVAEHISGKAKNMLLIPYNDLFFEVSQEKFHYDNNITLVIFDEAEEVLYQEQISVSFKLNPALIEEIPLIKFQREFLPVLFETELQSGSYLLYISIADRSSSKRREYRKEFIFPETVKELGYFFLKGKVADFEFVIRDKRYLYHPYDSLQVLQYVGADLDSTRIALTGENSKKYLSVDELTKLPELLKEGEVFQLELEQYYGEQTYISTPIYPNPAYFFQQKYSPKDQLAQLRYIVNENEYRYLRSLPENDLQQGINEYWQSKDPDPYTIDNIYQETFYQRIRYANNNYQFRRFMPGWRTDMGRIYIMYGRPDQIESDVFPLGRSPSITWYYYSLNKVFKFYDLRGYGAYELRDKWMD